MTASTALLLLACTKDMNGGDSGAPVDSAPRPGDSATDSSAGADSSGDTFDSNHTGTETGDSDDTEHQDSGLVLADVMVSAADADTLGTWLYPLSPHDEMAAVDGIYAWYLIEPQTAEVVAAVSRPEISMSPKASIDIDGDGELDVPIHVRDHGDGLVGGYVVWGPVTTSSTLAEASYLHVAETAVDDETGRAWAEVWDGTTLQQWGVSQVDYDDGRVLFFDPATRDQSSLTADDASGVLVSDVHPYIGTHMESAGDFDADGVTDVLVGSLYNDVFSGNRGNWFVVNGPVTGTLATSDLDQDGSVELIVGSDASYDPHRGALYVVSGPFEGVIDVAEAARSKISGDENRHSLDQGIQLDPTTGLMMARVSPGKSRDQGTVVFLSTDGL